MMVPAVCLLVCTVLQVVRGHGWLEQPAGRSSAWRYGFGTPANYDDNGLNCGGFDKQYNVFGGKCGLCGDPYGGPLLNEPGPSNVYATGVIVANYTQGQAIPIKIQVTAQHQGYHEFRLCKNDVPQLGRNRSTAAKCDPMSPGFPILQSPDGRTRFDMLDPAIVLKLPADITCQACILQWRYRAGNNWGCDTSGCGLGYGNQEEFYGCADIRIIATAGAAASAVQVEATRVIGETTRSTLSPKTSAFAIGQATGTKTTPSAGSTVGQGAVTKVSSAAGSTVRQEAGTKATAATVHTISQSAGTTSASAADSAVRQEPGANIASAASPTFGLNASTKTTTVAAPKTTSVRAGTARKLVCVAAVPNLARWCNVVCNSVKTSCPARRCLCKA